MRFDPPSRRSRNPAGQSYLESVSDLVAAFLFVFIILLAVFAADWTRRAHELEAADEVRAGLLEQLSRELGNRGMKVEIMSNHGILRLSEEAIRFPRGSEIPASDPENHRNIGLLAHALGVVVPCYVPGRPPGAETAGRGRGGGESVASGATDLPLADHCDDRPAHPECGASGGGGDTPTWTIETLLIEGHTDTVPVVGSARFRNNLELSSMRAATVHQMITVCEPGLAELHNQTGLPILSTSGYGDTRLVEDDGQADENRRIDLRFLLEPSPDLLPDTAP